MARNLETGNTEEIGPDARRTPSSGELIERGRTIIDPAAAHDLEVRGVTVVDKGRRSYRNKLVNRGRTVVDRRSEQ
jgi:hypothetical protein